MTWLEYLNLLTNALREVEIPPEGPVPHIPEWLRRQTFEQNQSADDAAFHFAEHWKWPPIPDSDVRYQLYFRCQFAIAAFEFFARQGYPEYPGYDRPRARRLLAGTLVHSWAETAFQWADETFP